MAGPSGLPAGPGLPGGRSSHHHVPRSPAAPRSSWRIGDLLLMGTPPGCWPDAPPGEAAVARLVLTAEPAALSAAREFARKSLADWGLTDLTWDSTTIVSELLTNAITHSPPAPLPAPARGVTLQIVLLAHDDRLAIVVTDPSVKPPVRTADPAPDALLCDAAGEPDPVPDAPDDFDCFDGLLAESGRGLHIVGGLSQDWGWAPLAAGGKAVWAVLADTAEPPAGPHT